MQGNFTTVVAVAVTLDLSAWDNIEFWFYSNDTTDGRLLYLTWQTSPLRPKTPSIIVTGKKISNS